MKGFVPTPHELVDLMVGKLFRAKQPTNSSTLLDPGCGEGQFIEGVLRWCRANSLPVPRILGVEQHPGRAAAARAKFSRVRNVEILTADFLAPSEQRFDFIIGNPPYVSLGSLSVAERESYRTQYATARGRFDLYMLFFEQALRLLRADGRLVFVTPEKFTYVDSARALRSLMLERSVESLHYVSESTFDGFVTYPVITALGPLTRGKSTAVITRDGTKRTVKLQGDHSWQSVILGEPYTTEGPTLADVCARISCGVATGADHVFVVRNNELDDDLRRYAYPTISGRQLPRNGPIETSSLMLVPYDARGRLLPEPRLGSLGRYLRCQERREVLAARTCSSRKAWYAFHDSVPLDAILRPKILCKDISPVPFFVADDAGEIVPRHSAYYIVPTDPSTLSDLLDYLNSPEATKWLLAHCQRAANGFVRLQSSVLKRLPVPNSIAPDAIPATQLEIETVAAFA